MGEAIGGDQDEIVAAIVDGSGSTLVRSDQPADLAVALADALDADLEEGVGGLADALQARLASVDERTRALAALELHSRLHEDDAPDRHHILADVGALRRLVGRIEEADRFVDDSRGALVERLGSGTELAVHPETIRKAATDVLVARAERDGALEEVAEEEAAGSVATEPEPERATEPALDPERRRMVVRSAAAVAAACALGLLAVLLSGSLIPLVLPVVALAWGGTEWVRSREDAADRDVASDNLAAVSALTDRAYGGVALSESEELIAARRRLAAAEERLRYAETAWHALVGADVDAESVDDLLAQRDPQFHVGEQELSRTPTLRAADGHRRRLLAQWKLVWWALDRPVVPLDRASEAIDELEDEGIDAVAVETWAARSPERAEDADRFDELAAGRNVHQLREIATARPAPLVVLDEEGEISGADLAARTAVLPSDVRVVVVGPTTPADAEGD